MTHQQTPHMTDEERTSHNIEDIFGFLKELVARPEMIEQIPDGSRLRVTPVDDVNGHRDGEPVARTEHYRAYVVPRTEPENDESH